jgi:hypothetical protein
VVSGWTDPILRGIVIGSFDEKTIEYRVRALRNQLKGLDAFPLLSTKRKGAPLEGQEQRVPPSPPGSVQGESPQSRLSPSTTPPSSTTTTQRDTSVTSWVNTSFTAPMLQLNYNAPIHLNPTDARTSARNLEKQARLNYRHL